MASIINASNSTGLTLTSDLSGTLQFQNNGVNLPMSGVAPLFSATASTNQSIANGTPVKIAFDTKVYDTNNNYSTANYRFTPTVAGYYQFNAAVFAATGSARPILSLDKNGSPVYQQAQVSTSVDGGGNISLAYMVYANGSTDYFEIYYQQSTGGSITINSSGGLTFFQGYLVRGA